MEFLDFESRCDDLDLFAPVEYESLLEDREAIDWSDHMELSMGSGSEELPLAAPESPDGVDEGGSSEDDVAIPCRGRIAVPEYVAPRSDTRNRAWVFTLNNYSLQDEKALQQCKYQYISYGREVGASGTPHLQGYIYFKAAVRFSALKKLLKYAHWEVARGSAADNARYTQKDGDFFEDGDRPKSPKEKGANEKARWAANMELCKQGRLEEVDPDIRFRFYRTCKEIQKDYMVPPSDSEDVTGIWYYGVAGAGKSRAARANFPGAYLKMVNKWWDGYQGEDAVIMDDFDRGHDKLAHHLKIWGDRYSFLAETKGGVRAIRPSKFIVTSQYHPDEIWLDAETRDAIKRRFKLTHFSGLVGNP